LNPAQFSTQIVLVSGINKIEISDTNSDGIETTTVTVTSTRIRNDIRVNMVWDDSASDVDLHIFTPSTSSYSSEHIYFGNKKGTIGELDVDNVVGYGPENISFSAGTAVTGTYIGAVNLYNRAGSERNISVRVTIYLNEGTITQSVISLDTIVVTVPNQMRDVGADQPSNVNSNSTKFFSFAFSPFIEAKTNEKVISFPNPFFPLREGLVTFKSESGMNLTTVTILSIDGRIVRRLIGTGQTTITWDGRNTQGELLSSGIYLILAQFENGKTATSKMTLIH